MPTLDLRRGAFSACWLKTLEIMQGDEVLARAIKTWRVWDGGHASTRQDIEIGSDTPILRMEPTIAAMSWYDPSSQSGMLQVKLRLIIRSWEAEDYLNLWEAVIDSLYPYGEEARQLANEQMLRDAGATTGQWKFAFPAATPALQGEDGAFACDGMMQLEVAKQFL